jgi:hypothetical protein
MIGASFVPLYLVFRTKIPPLRIFSLLLGLFALSHGLYHLLFTFVVGYTARESLDTLSVVVLVIFGIYYNAKGGLT